MTDNLNLATRDMAVPVAEDGARSSAQDARQGRDGRQMLVVLCTSIVLLVSAYIAMLAFANA